MKSSLLRWALGGCALLPLMVQAAAQIGAKPVTKPAPVENQVLLQADELVYDDEHKVVSALGHVEIVDEGRTLIADRVEYDQASDKVVARGHVSITDVRGNVAFADHVVLTDHMRRRAAGIRRADRQDRTPGRHRRGACGRQHRHRPSRGLFALHHLPETWLFQNAAMAGYGSELHF